MTDKELIKYLFKKSMWFMNFNTDYIISGAWREKTIDEFAKDYNPKDYEVADTWEDDMKD